MTSLRRDGLVVGDVPDLAVQPALEHEARSFGDVVDMGAVHDMARLDDPPRLARAQLGERVAAGAVARFRVGAAPGRRSWRR